MRSRLSHTAKTPAQSPALTNFSAPTSIANLLAHSAFLAEGLNAFGGPQTICQTLDLIARRACSRN